MQPTPPLEPRFIPDVLFGPAQGSRGSQFRFVFFFFLLGVGGGGGGWGVVCFFFFLGGEGGGCLGYRV